MNPKDIKASNNPQLGYQQGSPQVIDDNALVQNYTTDITQVSHLESLEEPLEVHTAAASEPSANTMPKRFMSGAFFSRRRAMVISTLITLAVLALTVAAMAFLVRRAPDDQQKNTQVTEQQDVKIEGALDSTIPKELQGAKQSLLVNGDVVTRGDLRISSGGFATVIRVLDPTEDQVLTLPSGSGTICLDNNSCGYAALDDLTAMQEEISTLQGNVDDINTILSDLEARAPAAGVDTLNNQRGAVSIQGSPNRINISTNNGVVTLTTPQDLDTNANVQFGSLTVSSILANGVLVGNGANPVLSVGAGGAGLCLMSTAGAPSFQVCPGGSSSFTLAGTSGTSQTINGGDTLTIAAGNNVTTTAGVTDTVTVGTVNNPNFTSSVTTPLLQSSGALSISPGGALTAGATNQTTLLQGSSTTITSSGAGNDIVLTSADQIRLTGFNCAALGNGGKLTTDASGNVSCAADNGSAGAAITGAGSTNRVALFTGTNTVADSWLLQNGSTLELDNTRNLSLSGGNFSVVGTGLFSGLVTANGGLTIEAGDTFTFNGEAFTDLTGTGLSLSSGSLQTTLGTSIDLTSEVTGILPVASGGTGMNSATATNGQLLVGNGTGFTLATIAQGSGITITNGAGSITVASTLGVAIDSAEITDLTITNTDIANSTINLSTKTTGNYVATVADSGSGVISVSGSGSNNAAVTLGLVADSIGDTQLAFNTGQHLTTASSPSFAGATVTGGTFTVGTTSQLAGLVLHDGNGQTTTLRPGDSAGNLTFVLPVADGAANQCIKTNASGALSFGDCVTSIGGGGGVTGSGTQNRVSKFGPGGTSVADSTISDDGTNVTTSVDLIVQGGGLTLGTAIQNAALTLYGNGFTATIDTSAIDASNTYSLPAGAGGDFCIRQLGNCSGSGGGNAPVSSQYLTLALDAGLSAERTLSFNGTNFSVVDNGANNSYTVNTAQNINTAATPSFAGLTLTGNLQLNANTLQGGAAVIDFTSFDVASGGSVTAGTYNSQTISSTASLTGTLAVAGLTTLNGGLTVDPGDTFTFNGDAFTDLTGNGLQVTTNTLTILAQASKGLEVDSNGLSLIDCVNGEVLKYNGSNQWACATDSGSGGVGDDVSVNGVAATGANFLNTAASGTVASVTWALNNVSNPDDISLTIGVASNTEAGVVTTGTQTFAGTKTFNGSVVLAASQSITVTGGNTASRPGSPTEGMVYFDSDTDRLLVYSNGKWQADRTDAVLVAASNSSQSDKDAADYVADGNGGGAADGDQVEINTALTAGAGKKIVLLSGTYTADGTILIPDNTTLTGVGISTIVRLDVGSATENLIENSNQATGYGITITNLTIDGSLGTGGVQNGIYLNGGGSSQALLDTTTPNNLTELTSTTWNFGNEISLESIMIESISGNDFRSTSNIDLNDTYVITFSNNTLGDIAMTNGTYTAALTDNYSWDVVLTTDAYITAMGGNYIDDLAVDDAFIESVTNNSMSNVTFTNNAGFELFDGNITYGHFNLANTGSFSGLISNNQIYDGLVLDTVDDATVTGNRIWGYTITGFAIDVTSSASNNNYFADNTLGSGTVNNLGTGTVFGGQVNSSGNFMIQPTGTIELLKNTNVTGTLNITSDVDTNGSLTVGNANQFVISNTGVVTSGTWNGTAVADTYVADNLTISSSGTVDWQALSNYPAACGAGQAITQLADSVTCTTFAAGSGSGNYIQNQSGSQQSASTFWISGTGRTDTSFTTPLIDTPTTTALNIGTTNATAINLNKNVVVAASQSLTLTGGNTASRPGSPTEGMLYYDTDIDQLLIYNGTKWQADSQEAVLVAASDSSPVAKAAADYIADGTGDQAEITSAITEATATTGSNLGSRKVYLFAGTYSIADTISLPNNAILSGAGNSTLLQFANLGGVSKNMITNTTTGGTGTGVIVRDLRLDGNKTTNSTDTFTGIYLDGIGSSSTNLTGATITHVTIQNFENNGIHLANVANNIITSNTIQSNDDHGIYTNNGNHEIITGNIVTNNTLNGIYLTSTVRSILSNNTLISNANAGLRIDTGSNNIISTNIFRNNAASGTNSSMFLFNTDANNITANNITDTAGSGYAIDISDSGSDTNYLSNNTFSGTGATTINDIGTGTVFANQIKDTANGNLYIQPAGTIELMKNTNITGTLNITSDVDTNGSLTVGNANQFVVSNTGVVTAGTWQGTAVADTFVADNLTISSSGNVDWQALSNYPAACSAGQAVTQVGDSITCSAFLTGSASSYIQNQSASQQSTSTFWISGTGRTDTSFTTPLLDTPTATALNIGTTNATAINLNKNVVVAATQSLTLTGGNTASRPVSPTEGMVYFDSDTDRLIVYSNGKWQADRSDAVLVAANNSSQADKDAADFIADGNTGSAADGDQVQINAALSAASGKKVVLLAGTYVADETILIPNNTTLTGVGKGTLIELADLDASENLIENSDTTTGTGVTVRDLQLNGRKDLNTAGIQRGLSLSGMGGGVGSSARQGALVTGLLVTNFRNENIYLTNSNNNIVSDNTSQASSSEGLQLTTSSNNVIANNKLQGNTAAGFNANSTSASNNISGNHSQGNGGSGFSMASGSYNTFTSNTSLGNTYGFFITSSYNTITGNSAQGNSSGGFNTSGTNNTFTGNTAIGGTYGINIGGNYASVTGNTVQGTTYGIALDEDYGVISGNNISSVTVYAIHLNGANSSVVSGNKIHDSGGNTTNNGIYLATSDSNQITGNVVSDSSASSNNYAINISNSTADTNTLSDNTLGGGSINDSGTGTVYSGQTNSSGNFVVQPAGTVELMKNTNITGTLNITSDVDTNGSLTVGNANQFVISNTGVVTSGTWNGTAVVDTYVADTLTINSSSTVDWQALSNYPAACSAGQAVTQLGDSITCTAFAAGSGSGSYIQNQSASQQSTSTFWVSGTGRTDTSFTTPLLDTPTATALNIGTTNATQINLNKNVVIAASQSLTITGGNTASRPGSPTEGMVYFDSDTDRLLTYSNGKWQADRSDAIIVAASNSTQADKDAADYVADGNTGVAADGDQVQINAALTAASGRKVVLLAGTYVADATILIPNNTALAGVGNGTLIELADLDTSDNLIEATGSTRTGQALRDMRLDGRSDLNTAGSQWGVYYASTGSSSSFRTGGTITNVHATRFRSYNFVLISGANNTLANSTSQNSGGHGIYVGGDNNTLTGNTVTGSTNTGILITSSSNNTFDSNHVYNNSSGGFLLDGSSNNIFTNNNVQGSGFNITNLSDNNIVSNNRIQDSGGSTSNNGVNVSDSDSNTITGNAISDGTGTTNCSTTCYAINIFDGASETNYLADNTLGNGTINDAGTGTIYGGQTNGSSNYVVQPAGTVELMKNTNVTGTLNITSNVDTNGSLTVGSANQFVISNTGVVTSGTWNGTAVTGAYGGTGQTTTAVGDLLLGAVGNTWNKLAIGGSGTCLLSNGTTAAWNACTATDLPGAYAATATTSSAAEITLADAKGLRIIATDTSTDPSIIMKLNCTGCATGTTGNFLVQNNSSAALFSVAGNGSIAIGTAGNGISLSGSGGTTTGAFTLSGTARNTKTIRLLAEYPSVVLTPDGSNNLGTMTSGYDNTASARMNYYNWTTTQVTNQDYDIVVQVPLPSDFDGWSGSNPLSITGYTTNTTNGTILVEARDSADVQRCNFVSVTPGSASTWSANNSACTLSAGTYTPGDYMTLRFRLQAPTSGNTRVGNIVLTYNSKF